MKTILLFAVLILCSMPAYADTSNCVGPTIVLSQPSVAVGEQFTIWTYVTNTCSGPRTVSYGIELESACLGGYDSLLQIPSLTLAKNETATFAFTYTPSCADVWEVHAETLYNRRYTNEALATITVTP